MEINQIDYIQYLCVNSYTKSGTDDLGSLENIFIVRDWCDEVVVQQVLPNITRLVPPAIPYSLILMAYHENENEIIITN